MAMFDMPLEKLETYKPKSTKPADFDKFWKRTLAETAAHPLNAKFERVNDPAYNNMIEVYDVTFNGYAGHPVKGWFLKPAGTTAKLPCIVQYIGYGGGRSVPVEHLGFPTTGIALFVMDTRGQGSSWSNGDTPDPHGYGPHAPGSMTKGIESPDTYYYRRVYTDAVRAIDAAASNPHVDAKRIGVMGGSQGGGIAIAAAGLAGNRVKIAMPDVPFLCDFKRATTIVDSMPYGEIVGYLKAHRGKETQVYKTLAYFDGVNLAQSIKARSLFSVGLMDVTCPPSTVYGAFNQIKAPKEIRVYPYNNHEGGGQFQTLERMRFALKYL